MLSRLTGLARDVVVSAQFGASGLRDAFEVAFQLPNMLRRLFAEGAFSQAFVPMLSRVKAAEGDEATRVLLNRVASLQLVALLATNALAMLLAPWLIYLSAAHFSVAQHAVATDLLRIMFPYLLFISLVALAGGALNVYKHFAIPAVTPVLLNVGSIFGATVLANHYQLGIHGLAWGVFLGGVLQLLLQIWPLHQRGLLPKWDWQPGDSGVMKIVKGIVPALLGVSVAQVSLLINTNYAAFFGEGSVTWLKTADRMMELPLGLLGVALGTVLLPSLSKSASTNDSGEYSKVMDWGLRLAVILALPAGVGLAVEGGAIVATLFHRGAFTAADVLQTHWSVAAYSVGILSLVLIKILAPGFYARQDIQTPVRVAIWTLLATQVLNVLSVFAIFPADHRHAALAFGTSLGAAVNAGLLFYLLRKRGHFVPQAGWLRFASRVLLACALMGLTLWGLQKPMSWWVASGEWLRLGRLFLELGAAGLVYFVALAVLGFRLRDFRR
jgi:putative peptidoglycan lipid II flippase